MPVHRFAVFVAGAPTALQADALVNLPDRPLVRRRPRCGDGVVTFERPGPDSLAVALGAINDIEAVGLRAVRVVGDDWVTLGDIAGRVGRSREAVRLWAAGHTGPGGFPPPLNPGRDTLFYSWVEVSTWLRRRLGRPGAAGDPGLVVADLLLRLRTLVDVMPRLRRDG